MKRAFTLVEAMIIIAVLGVIMAVALPRYGGSLVGKLRVQSTARRIQSDLRLTRRLAIANNDDYILKIAAQGDEYQIYKNKATAGNEVGEVRTISSQISVSGDKTFTFEPAGNAASNSGTDLSLSAGGHQYDITVNIATGRVSIAE